MIGGEDERESAKEEIKEAQEDGRVDVEDEAHGLEGENLERSKQGVSDCGEDGAGCLFDGGEEAVVPSLGSQAAGLAGDEYWVYRMESAYEIERVVTRDLGGEKYGMFRERRNTG